MLSRLGLFVWLFTCKLYQFNNPVASVARGQSELKLSDTNTQVIALAAIVKFYAMGFHDLEKLRTRRIDK